MLKRIFAAVSVGCLFTLMIQISPYSRAGAESAADYSLVPPFVTAGVPPLVMLVLGRDHKLYYEAYNDASDIDGDGNLDIGFKPAIEYYGYFDANRCYEYVTGSSRFEPRENSGENRSCGAGKQGRWSGNFLNYLTTSRMDALRKVLYGGYRSVDTASETVLERVFIPQDAHSWGKEYTSAAHDGYDISLYSPLALPVQGRRHLFASTAVALNGNPLLRVLPDNPARIWEWVSKERPVADNSLEIQGGYYTGHPQNRTEFQALIDTYSHPGNLQEEGPISIISDAPNRGDRYMTLIEGELVITQNGSYRFAVDGDDAVEFLINDQVVAGWYGSHSVCNCRDHYGTVSLGAGVYSIRFHHQEGVGQDSCHLYWSTPGSGNKFEVVPASQGSIQGLRNLTRRYYSLYNPPSLITDYVVRVQVGVPGKAESNCKQYPNGTWKPIGILQKHGESDRMYFGLVTGSYTKNTSGGVLRKNVGTIRDEINPDTGQFTSVNGIIQTINKLRIVGFSYSDYSYNVNCGWIATSPIVEGQCRMWGNPVAEMMYETLRYFAGAGKTSAFDYSGSTDDSSLGLPKPAWINPYDTANGGYSHCAKPFMLVISDINPSFDTDQLPGSAFSSFSGSLGNLNVQNLANIISGYEGITSSSGDYYIGHSMSNNPASDSACTPKGVSGFGTIRGLCPEEPTKQGGYYSASVAYHGLKEDTSAVAGLQSVTTYAVALASPLPRIEIPFGQNHKVTLVPFAKSVAGYNINKNQGQFQPTNTIVDFYVETISETYGKFRINFEDVEQGADHDMDAIVIYEYWKTGANTLRIKLTSEYAAGSIVQHMGYIISGTTSDGTYLEVRDADTAAGSDVSYFLDTQPSPLPLVAERTFTVGTTSGASLLQDPLWYAAKWGGFEDSNDNALPDISTEWDKDGNGIPDTYFYVTNPLKLEEQLNKSFADILRRSASGTAASVISSTRSGEGAVYQAVFYPEYKDWQGNTVHWVGEVHAFLVDAYGNMREDTNRNGKLDPADDYFIRFSSDSVGTIYKYKDINANSRIDAEELADPIVLTSMRPCRANETDVQQRNCISYLWSSGATLNELPAAGIVTQRAFTDIDNSRHIFTFLDGRAGTAFLNMVPDTGQGEIVDFVDYNGDIHPFLHPFPPFGVQAPEFIEPLRVATNQAPYNDFLERQHKRVINFIRGADQPSYTSSTSPSYTIPAFRSRQADYDEDGAVETWRLSDIVHSTPTIVSAPAEDFDLLYRDSSYIDFYRKYRQRRTVIYAGSNGGMIHAFNGGFYDSAGKKFWKGYNPAAADYASRYSDTGRELGSELWAYVPYNLLPHLYWLTDPSYTHESHVAYVDLKPRVFDAKIFAPDDAHPNGWGTVLVCGMRFGGGKIRADLNKNNIFDNADRTMSSAFIIMDITDPEQPPKLLAEISDSSFADALGFTTCYPAVITLKANTSDPNLWYLVFGSGPRGPEGADATAMQNASSNQPAKIFLVDLKELGTNGVLRSVDGTTNTLSNPGQLKVFATLDPGIPAFVSDPIAVDYELDYKTDAVYFGTVSGSLDTGWGGKLKRIAIKNLVETGSWDKDTTLIDLTEVSAFGHGQPITAAPSAAKDSSGNGWVYFGTGRFFNRSDATHHPTSVQTQTFYGIKEPRNSSGFTWQEVFRDDLLDVTDAMVFEGGNTVQGVEAGNMTFNELKALVSTKKGWYLDLTTEKERNLGQATILGNILTFTSYIPSVDPCEFEGYSNLYALYYATGTAYSSPVIGLGSTTVIEGEGENASTKYEVLKSVSLGKGLTLTPNIHTGRQEGSSVFVQTSTGTILQIDQQNPGTVKSGKASWEEW